MAKKVPIKWSKKWSPSIDWKVRTVVRKLRENGDHRLADKVGQMPLPVGGIVRREPEQLELFPLEPF